LEGRLTAAIKHNEIKLSLGSLCENGPITKTPLFVHKISAHRPSSVQGPVVPNRFLSPCYPIPGKIRRFMIQFDLSKAMV
jgi:hypothetical protein